MQMALSIKSIKYPYIYGIYALHGLDRAPPNILYIWNTDGVNENVNKCYTYEHKGKVEIRFLRDSNPPSP